MVVPVYGRPLPVFWCRMSEPISGRPIRVSRVFDDSLRGTDFGRLHFSVVTRLQLQLSFSSFRGR